MGQPPTGRADYLELGSWNVACAECGRKRKAEDMRKLPKGVPGAGLYVCYPEHWDSRHPQEFVRGIPDRPAAPYAQLQIDDFVDSCTLEGVSSLADLAVADCAICDYLPDFGLEPGNLALALDEDPETLILTDAALEIFP